MNYSKQVIKDKSFSGEQMSGRNWSQCQFKNVKVVGKITSGNFARSTWDSKCDLTEAEFEDMCNISFMKFKGKIKKKKNNLMFNQDYVEPVIEEEPEIDTGKCPLCGK